MSPTALQVLDKIMDCGDRALSGKEIIGKDKGAGALLEEMCSSGLLEKTASKSPKYTVTLKGRQTWEREVSEERRRQIEHREQDQLQRTLREFLIVVQSKPDQSLKKTDLSRFPTTLRQLACERKLVQIGTKKDAYQLLPAGEASLLADQPAAHQLSRLRELAQKVTTQWKSSYQKITQELDRSASDIVRRITEELAQQAEQALQRFDAALTELAAFTRATEALRELREQVETTSRQAYQALTAEKDRLAEIETRLQQAACEQQEQLQSLERQLTSRLDDLARKLESATVPVESQMPLEQKSFPPDEAVWQAVREAYERLHQENLRIGGIVKVPDLTDAVVKGLQNISPARVHELLTRWQQQDKLTLQVCNDSRLEPRATEGIQSSRGLLFYVQMR